MNRGLGGLRRSVHLLHARAGLGPNVGLACGNAQQNQQKPANLYKYPEN